MVRGFVFALVFVVIFSATAAYAQTDVQAQIEALLKKIGELQHQLANTPVESTIANTNTGVGLVCPVFSRTLSRGAQGDDVRELQKILQSGGYLKTEPTGYFGALTEKALQNFQAKAKLVSSGSPAKTGWGVFGPRTRAFISSLCANELQSIIAPPVTPSAPAPTCPAVSDVQPKEVCVGVWQKLQDSKGCSVGWKCFVSESPNTTNKTPDILSIDGITTLQVNETGVWTISASDPENGSLQYGVIWGDEGADTILTLLAGYGKPAFSSASRISHSYITAGKYTAEINVRDSAGNVAFSTLSITVSPRPAGGSTTAPTPTPAPTPTTNSCLFAGISYPEGTQTEGHSLGDLCLTTGGVCQPSSAYTPKYKCVAGAWASALENPFPNLPAYGNIVGTSCSANGTTREVIVWPNTQLCRGLLCALAQTYTPIVLTCQYTNWVDWGLFRAGATTTTVCASTAPCEYWFGTSGRACAPKINGACAVPSTGHPLGT
ncbi:MAG: peptidoglycan-binding domain-containing protein [bacterium]|nr:peptidoglycan-binding domain-containing protein [bacterium]